MAHSCLLVNKVSHSLLIGELWAPLKLIFRLGTYLERCRVERKRMNASNMSVLFLMRIGHRLDQLEPNPPRRLPLGRPCRYMWQELFPSWSPPITNLLQEVPGIITKTEHRSQTMHDSTHCMVWLVIICNSDRPKNTIATDPNLSSDLKALVELLLTIVRLK